MRGTDPKATSVRYDLLPSEMWHRQFCACGPLEIEDIEGRYEVGVANIAWGSDYPHSEGTWPISRRWLGFLFKDLTREETDLLVSGNAARFLGFDLDALARRQPPPSLGAPRRNPLSGVTRTILKPRCSGNSSRQNTLPKTELSGHRPAYTWWEEGEGSPVPCEHRRCTGFFWAP